MKLMLLSLESFKTKLSVQFIAWTKMHFGVAVRKSCKYCVFPKQTRHLLVVSGMLILGLFTGLLSFSPPSHTQRLPSPPERSVTLLSDNASFSPRLRSGIYMKLLIVCSSNRVSLEPAVCQKLRTDSLTSLPLSVLLSEREGRSPSPGWSAWQNTGRGRASWHHPLCPTSENITTINLTSTEMHSRVFFPTV